jgi:hypothetical protein
LTSALPSLHYARTQSHNFLGWIAFHTLHLSAHWEELHISMIDLIWTNCNASLMLFISSRYHS